MSKKSKLFTVRVEEENERHSRVAVFNRGANAGVLTILTEDVDELVRRLYGSTAIEQSVGAGAKVTGVKIGRLG